MTASRDPDRLIHAYLLEGAERLQDRVYDAVRADIETRRQRGRIGPWRTPSMNKLLPAGLGAAVVVAALVVGGRLLGPPGPGGVGASPSPSPLPSPTASLQAPTGAPSPSSPTGTLPEGPFVLAHPGGGPAVTLTIPGPGWSTLTDYGVIVKTTPDPPAGAAIMGPFLGDLYVYGDPCQWSTTLPDAPATTVDAAIAALAAQPSRNASEPVAVTADGYSGKSIILHVPDDHVSTDCDEGIFASWAGGGFPLSEGPTRYHQGPGQIDEIWILDVDGELVVVEAMYGKETPATDVAEMRAMLETMTFE